MVCYVMLCVCVMGGLSVKCYGLLCPVLCAADSRFVSLPRSAESSLPQPSTPNPTPPPSLILTHHS